MNIYRTELLAATFFALTGPLAIAQQPTPLLTRPALKLVEVLQSDASQKEKADACRELSVLGSKEAIPVLATLLGNEALSHMARYALETIPDPAADRALREALPNLQGRLLAGVIGSIGVRNDAAAVPELAGLLQNTDADVAQAASRALGKIATAPAIEALREAVGKGAAANGAFFSEGLLRCAEALESKGEHAPALAIYEQLRRLPGPQPIRVAGLRGAILAQGKDGVDLLRDSLRSDDDVTFATGVGATYDARGLFATKALAGELKRLTNDDRKVLIIQALAKRNDQAAVVPLTEAARSGQTPVRVAALRALAETGDAAAAPTLIDVLGDNETAIAQAALESLATLPGKPVDSAVMALLKNRNKARRLAGFELAARRRLPSALPVLIKATAESDSEVRQAALSKFGELGGSGDAASLLDVLANLNSPADLAVAEEALTALSAKASPPDRLTPQLTARLGQLPAGAEAVVLQVLGNIGGSEALQAVQAALKNPDPAVRSAAIRALGNWKTVDAAPDLLGLAKDAANPVDQTVARRGYLGLAANPDIPPAKRLELCRAAAAVVRNEEDKRLLLSALGAMDSSDAAGLITPYLRDPATEAEASAALLAVAERLLKGAPTAPAVSGLLEPLRHMVNSKDEAVATRAKAALEQVQKMASKP
ncbi:MAG: HEAT repeat domain-containing protein [Verrucomicrobiota bacterium]